MESFLRGKSRGGELKDARALNVGREIFPSAHFELGAKFFAKF